MPVLFRPRRRRSRWRPAVTAAILAILVVIAGVVLLLTSAGARLTADPAALAQVTMPFGGGHVTRVDVTAGPNSRAVPVTLRGEKIWPAASVPAGETLTVEVTITRPGWIGWLAGSSERLRLNVTAPRARLAEQYVTLKPGEPLRVGFTTPVRTIAYGLNPGNLHHETLASPQAIITLPHSASAGTMFVAAAPRSWESSGATSVSWFPAGAAASVVTSPAPGSRIRPTTPITLTFSKPVAQALGSVRPPVTPTTPGTWRTLSSHAIQFVPTGYGYGIGARVSVGLPRGVLVVGATHGAGPGWSVPDGSTLRLQQLLASLGYLPLQFTPAPGAAVVQSASAEEQAALNPPAGDFSWRFPNIPGQLRAMWSPGADGVMTRGAVMAFQNDHGLATDGSAGPDVWRALIAASLSMQRSSFGYTFVSVDKSSQHLTLWHNGRDVLTTPVNTGIAQAPTASGTYPVYEHLRVTTMSGTNPDGSSYHDPGIQFVSYFNGGDALHAFTRAQYGFPQSLGCVEMALEPAGRVWPYTPIGTLVDVS